MSTDGRYIEENLVSGTTAADITDLTSTELVAAIAGHKVHITDLIITNNDALVGTVVKILNGATTKARFYVHFLTSPIVVNFSRPLLGATNTAWNVQCETTSAQVQATLVGYKKYA